MLPELRYRRFWMLSGVGIALLITLLSLMPNNQLPDVKMSDKVEHLLAYVLLTFWFGSIVVRRDYFWLVLSLLSFGALIEIAQGMMGWGRHGDLLDLRADAIGIALGLILALTPLGRWAIWLETFFRGKAVP